MMKSQAKRLKAGDRIIWTGDGPRMEGTITRKHYNTVWIKWDDGAEQTMYAEVMNHVFTEQQLADLANEAEVAAKIQAMPSWERCKRLE